MSGVLDRRFRRHRDHFLFHHVLDQECLKQRRLALLLQSEDRRCRRPIRSLSLNNPTRGPSSTTGIWRIRPKEITSLAKSNVSSGFSVTGEPIMIFLTTPSLPFLMVDSPLID